MLDLLHSGLDDKFSEGFFGKGGFKRKISKLCGVRATSRVRASVPSDTIIISPCRYLSLFMDWFTISTSASAGLSLDIISASDHFALSSIFTLDLLRGHFIFQIICLRPNSSSNKFCETMIIYRILDEMRHFTIMNGKFQVDFPTPSCHQFLVLLKLLCTFRCIVCVSYYVIRSQYLLQVI